MTLMQQLKLYIDAYYRVQDDKIKEILKKKIGQIKKQLENQAKTSYKST